MSAATLELRATLRAARAEARAGTPAAALAVPCPWCGAAPGELCTVRAAHPTTGRGMPYPVASHPERLEAPTESETVTMAPETTPAPVETVREPVDATVYVGRTAAREHVYAHIRITPADPYKLCTFTDHDMRPEPAELAIQWSVLSSRAPVDGGRVHPSDVSDAWHMSGGQTPADSRKVSSRGELYAAGRSPMPRADRDALASAWELWHLNRMHAGCVHMGADAGIGTVCKETGYRWGSAWLSESVPVDVLEAMVRIAATFGIGR